MIRCGQWSLCGIQDETPICKFLFSAGGDVLVTPVSGKAKRSHLTHGEATDTDTAARRTKVHDEKNVVESCGVSVQVAFE